MIQRMVQYVTYDQAPCYHLSCPSPQHHQWTLCGRIVLQPYREVSGHLVATYADGNAFPVISRSRPTDRALCRRCQRSRYLITQGPWPTVMAERSR